MGCNVPMVMLHLLEGSCDLMKGVLGTLKRGESTHKGHRRSHDLSKNSGDGEVASWLLAWWGLIAETWWLWSQGHGVGL